MLARATASRYGAIAALILAGLASIAIYNAIEYPISRGYDEAEHEAYADLLIHHGVTSSGISGSDLHLYELMGPFLEPGDVLGHEPMGIVRGGAGGAATMR